MQNANDTYPFCNGWTAVLFRGVLSLVGIFPRQIEGIRKPIVHRLVKKLGIRDPSGYFEPELQRQCFFLWSISTLQSKAVNQTWFRDQWSDHLHIQTNQWLHWFPLWGSMPCHWGDRHHQPNDFLDVCRSWLKPFWLPRPWHWHCLSTHLRYRSWIRWWAFWNRLWNLRGLIPWFLATFAPRWRMYCSGPVCCARLCRSTKLHCYSHWRMQCSLPML